MKRFEKAIVGAVVLAVLAVPAAASAGVVVSERPTRLLPQERFAAHGPIVSRADGGYQWTISADDVFGVEVGNVMTVNARKFADGTVNGIFHYKQAAFGQVFSFTVRVTCMNVYDGNRAKIGGVIEISNADSLPPGVFLWFQTIDNGQGADDPPDRSTIIGAGDEAENEAFCDSPDLPRFGPWDVQGNVHVLE